jgi:hypothetical protein
VSSEKIIQIVPQKPKPATTPVTQVDLEEFIVLVRRHEVDTELLMFKYVEIRDALMKGAPVEEGVHYASLTDMDSDTSPNFIYKRLIVR